MFLAMFSLFVLSYSDSAGVVAGAFVSVSLSSMLGLLLEEGSGEVVEESAKPARVSSAEKWVRVPNLSVSSLFSDLKDVRYALCKKSPQRVTSSPHSAGPRSSSKLALSACESEQTLLGKMVSY